jgi:hypothetical protein
VNVGGRHVGHVRDFAIQPDKEAGAARDVLSRLAAHAVSVCNVPSVSASSVKFNLCFSMNFLWLSAESLTPTTSTLSFSTSPSGRATRGLFGAARRVILGIEVEEDNLLAEHVRQLPGLVVLIFAFNERGFVARLWSLADSAAVNARVETT